MDSIKGRLGWLIGLGLLIWLTLLYVAWKLRCQCKDDDSAYG